MYADGQPNMNAVKGLAKQIYERWCRMQYEINTRYDAEGQYDLQYRQLKQKVAGRQMRSESDSEDSPQAKQPQKAKKSDESQIKRGRVGIIMPHRNAFDFIERPEMKETISSNDK